MRRRLRTAGSLSLIPAAMTDPPVWLNGVLVPQSAARLDPLAQGFLTGLGVYDSLRLRAGHPLFLTKHLRRITDGAARLGLPAPDAATVESAIASLAAAQGLTEGRVRITLGGGASPSVQPAAEGNIMLVTLAVLAPVKVSAALTVTPFRRNEHSPLAGIKYTACAENVLAQRAAIAAGFDEALFLNTAGEVCEGAFSNIFLVAGDRVLTPPLTSGCLPGVMREAVLELCAARGIPAEEKTLTAASLREADEVFVTSAIRGIQPVHRVDGRAFDAPGRITAALVSCLQAGQGITG